MKEQVLKQSQVFWKGLEQADTAAMRSVCDDKCFFVHIGGNCDLDREMDAFEKKVFQPTEIVLHIAHLRHADVSYVFAGKGSLDLPLAVQKLKEKFGIEKMLLSGGGIVDWAFLQAGLIDEISLVIPPVIDGGAGLASAFDDSVFAENHSSKTLSLIDVQRLDGDCIWLRYQTI